MKKALLSTLIAIIGSALLFVVVCTLVLFLAPGVKIFGIRYVSSGSSKCEVAEPLKNFSGDVFVEAKNVPITINFTTDYSFGVEFYQDFVGLTRSSQEKASLEIIYDESGNLHLTAKEMEKFIYAHEPDDKYHFTLNLPSVYFDGHRDLNIKADTSSITVNGVGICADLDISSNGDFTLGEKSGLMAANLFKMKIAKSITIKETMTSVNYDLTSTGGMVDFEIPVVGDIKATTDRGDLRFISCNNLTFNSKAGGVKVHGEGTNTVNGNVSINTTSGAVSLGEINKNLGETTTTIKTVGGSVSINKMKSGEIISERGRVNIQSADALVINNNTGDITIKQITESLTINGRNGKVTIGEGATVSNVKVSTTSGNIIAYNTMGTVTLKSSSGNVTLENSSSTAIDLHAGRALSAKNLRGTVTAYSKGDMSLHFAEVSGNVEISTGTKADNVTIDATAISHSLVNYNIKSTKGTKAKVYAGDAVVIEQSHIESSNANALYLFAIETSYAEVVLKFAV